MKPIKGINNGIAKKYAMLILVLNNRAEKKTKEFPDVYVKLKNDCIEFSDCEDFHILMYVPYSELKNVELREE